MNFYVQLQFIFLLHCDEWDRFVALPRHKFVTGATLLQLRCSRKLISSCSTNGTSHVIFVINSVMRHESGKDLIVIRVNSGEYGLPENQDDFPLSELKILNPCYLVYSSNLSTGQWKSPKR